MQQTHLLRMPRRELMLLEPKNVDQLVSVGELLARDSLLCFRVVQLCLQVLHLAVEAADAVEVALCVDFEVFGVALFALAG